MKVVIAIDSFKGSMTSLQAGEAARLGVLNANPNADCIVLPVADGGEGTMEALTHGLGGRLVSVEVTGPLGEQVMSTYGIAEKTHTAIIEMAAAAGLTLVPVEKRNPMITTTVGVGEMILDAYDRGCRKFIIGIGGSATNDGGVGMLSALGFDFLNSEGEKITPNAVGLKDLVAIKYSDKKYKEGKDIRQLISECQFTIACDVNNPLCGELGCSHIFAPQKGATNKMISDMDEWLHRYSEISSAFFGGKEFADCPGAGAAGGLGYAFLAYLGATLKSGIQIVMDTIDLEKNVMNADYVFTGEGRIDAQTAMGKVPIGVAKLAKKYGVPVIAFAGSIGEGAEELNDQGIDAFFPIIRKVSTLDELMDTDSACKNMKETVEQVVRVLGIK